MKTRSSYFAAMLLATALITGCGSQKGKTLFTAGPGSEPAMGTAPDDGTYTLYTAMSPNPTLTVKLKSGDKIGFQKTADGKIQAIAGDQNYVFDKLTAQVYWKEE